MVVMVYIYLPTLAKYASIDPKVDTFSCNLRMAPLNWGISNLWKAVLLILSRSTSCAHMSNAPEEKAWMRASPSYSLEFHLGLTDFAISAYFHFMTTFTSQKRGEKSRIDISII